MSTSSSKYGGNTNLLPRDPQTRQGLVTVSHTFNTELVNRLNRPAARNEVPIYPLGGAGDRDCRRMEWAFTVKTPSNSLISTDGAVPDNLKRRRAPLTSAGLMAGTSSGIIDHSIAAITSLNGWCLSTTENNITPEEKRLAVSNQIQIIGVVDKDLKEIDGKFGRVFQTIVSGTVYTWADVDMPVHSLVRVTVPLPEDVIGQSKYARKGINPSKVSPIMTPVRRNSVAVDLLTAMNWWLRDSKSFVDVMGKNLTSTNTWNAACHHLGHFTMTSLATSLDVLQKRNAIPLWPLDANQNELDDKATYLRDNNRLAHHFYAAVGFVDSQDGGFNGTTVADKMKMLRQMLRDKPSLFAEALAASTQHVKSSGSSPVEIKNINARTVKIDSTTVKNFGAEGDGVGLMQQLMRGAFGYGDNFDNVFGTHKNDNEFISKTTGVASTTPGGQLVKRQATSAYDFVSAVSAAHFLFQANIVGRITQGARKGENCTLLMSTFV